MATRPPRGYVGSAEIVVKRSRFIATVARVDSEDAARAVIAGVRAEHPTARHHCSAFVVEVPQAQPIERSSDDGEPSGTAGAPILEVLHAAGLTQVVAVVTRYFGGVLLGTGGLARAYADATSEALVTMPRVTPISEDLLALELAPDEAGRITGALMARGVDVVDTTWSTIVRLTLATTDAAATAALVRELVQRPIAVEPAGTRITEVTQ